MKNIKRLLSLFFGLHILFLLACSANSSSDPCCVNDGSYTGTLDTGVYFTNVITPNADKFNDVYYIQGLMNYPNSQLQIFDGNDLVYSSTNYANGFAGDDNTGTPIDEGKYKAVFTTQNMVFTQTISIVRTKQANNSCFGDCVPHDEGDPLLVAK